MKHQLIIKARQALLKTLEKYQISKGDYILIGLSGGQDSLALTLIAHEFLPNVGVVIVDHNLQKDNPTQKIKTIAQTIGIKNIYIETVQIRGKSNLELKAREKRYTAFEKALDKSGAKCLLLAHTLDDQAETVFLNLIRGSGVNALKGMPQIRMPYVRPFLELTRSETLKICQLYKCNPWQDPTNKVTAKDAPLRVKIREQIIPEIEAVAQRDIKENLFRTAQNMADVEDLINELAQSHRTLQISKLKCLHKVVRQQILRNALLDKGANPSKMLKQHLEAVDKLITDHAGGSKAVQIPGKITVSRSSAGTIRIKHD